MRTFLAVTMISLSAGALAACSSEPSPREAGPGEQPQHGVSEAELTSLLAPEPGTEVEEYQATYVRYRLFGVQLSQVPSESFATLADTATWETRNVRVSELLGRNLRVRAIRPDGLELEGAAGVRLLPVGKDVQVRLIRHRFDAAAVHQGRHWWSVDGQALARLRERYGLGAQAEQMHVFSEPALKLSHVQPGGVLSRLGLREGELLFTLDGRPLTPSGLGTLADRLSQPGRTVRLRVYREAGFQVLTFSSSQP
jgi:hypothetical protein